ncbi:MAG: PAS domain S-box protein [Bradyrhizobiaceae bacterium]|nr:PAS domain S-box protein [Bradyrhizobiaceae bacterium]
MAKRGVHIALIYTMVGVGYIVASDYLLAELTHSMPVLVVLQAGIVKGLIFMVLSGLLFGYFLSRGEQKLAESRTQTMSLFESHPDPMWVVCESSETILDVNPAALALFEYTAEQFNNLRVADLSPKDQDGESQSRYINVAADVVTNNAIRKYQSATGKVIWASVRTSKITYNGQPAHLITGNDITTLIESWSDYRFADPTILKALQQLQLVADSIQDGYVFLDNSLVITSANQMFTSKSGLTIEDVVGTSLTEACQWLDTYALVNTVKATRETGLSGTLEAKHTSENEWFRIVVYPNSDGFTVFVRDITAEKSSEQRLRIEHERLMALISNTDSIIFTVDREQRLTLFNHKFAEAVFQDRPYPPMLGEYPQTLPLLSSILETWDEAVRIALKGQACTFEVQLHARSGQGRYKLMRLAPLVIETQIVGVGVVMQDIHDLRTSLERLRHTNAILSDIAQISSHQLRGPLSSIMTLLHLIDVDKISDQETKEVLQQLADISTDVDAILHQLVQKAQAIDA